MPLLKRTYRRLKTLPSGKKVRQTISCSGRVLETVPVRNRADKTRTGKRLKKRRERINI